ncbi:MAG: cysteine desulfurase family protein [Hyphomicrobiaceae bacterium]
MASPRIYLDHNASSPLRPEAEAAMIGALKQHGNASSVHGEGRAARRLVEDAREQVAGLVGCQPAEVVFTSGATEANCAALGRGWDVVYMAPIEHESVLAPVRGSGARVVELAVDQDGIVDVQGIADGDLPTTNVGQRALLTLQMANNETGVCQNVAAGAALAREHATCVHTDAVQACGRVITDFSAIGADLMSVSSHKIGGPMGAGALIVRDGLARPALIQGGGQERRRRAGTENVAAIAGFGAAAVAAKAELDAEMTRLGALRRHLEAEISKSAPDAIVIGGGADRLANTLCVAFPGELAETTVIKLDLAGCAISAGSACSSGKVGTSHVLTAMGLPPEIARSAVRISLGWNTTESSLEQFLSRIRGLLIAERRAVA